MQRNLMQRRGRGSRGEAETEADNQGQAVGRGATPGNRAVKHAGEVKRTAGKEGAKEHYKKHRIPIDNIEKHSKMLSHAIYAL
jgi:hypothetical protein